MPEPDRVTIDHASPLTVAVAVRSDRTGLAFKLWTRLGPEQDWIPAGAGISDDAKVDIFTLGVMPAGSSLAYWFNVGGPAGNKYSIDLVFLQNGQPLAGGFCEEAGKLTDTDDAVVEARVAFP